MNNHQQNENIHPVVNRDSDSSNQFSDSLRISLANIKDVLAHSEHQQLRQDISNHILNEEDESKQFLITSLRYKLYAILALWQS